MVREARFAWRNECHVLLVQTKRKLFRLFQRKKLFRSSPDAVVTVYMLNGQRVDVECHVDSTADDVFQVVTTHTNVMESHFFGLTYMKGTFAA